MKKGELMLALARIGLGVIFLWAFFDKIFGLGFSTEPGKAWINGVSPTLGFLKFGTRGPLSGLYQNLAGNPAVDWLFMIGLLGIGAGLLLGIAMRLSGFLGAILMILMYAAAFPPQHHPFLDEHIIYALLLIALVQLEAGKFWGFGKHWEKRIGKRLSWFK